LTARIELHRDNTRHRPGEAVSGVAEWALSEVPLSAAVRLNWHTEGRGTPEVGPGVSEQFGDIRADDRRPFRLTLDTMPYSFSGSVLSIVWRVELVMRWRGKKRETVETFRIVTMSPTGETIDPYRK
jgi:hypothetical protein